MTQFNVVMQSGNALKTTLVARRKLYSYQDLGDSAKMSCVDFLRHAANDDDVRCSFTETI